MVTLTLQANSYINYKLLCGFNTTGNLLILK